MVGAAVAAAVGGEVGADGGCNCGPEAAGCGGPTGGTAADGGPMQADPSLVTAFVNPCGMHVVLADTKQWYSR